jgi:tetratricopeptide (TPR) repeat protein
MEMVNVRSIRATIFASVLFLSLSQSGCSVFSSIGGWFSQGYDDTIAYFNAYYNAKRLFDEAEAEVLAARSSSRANPTGASLQSASGSTAKQKFTVVIDKCSNVLSFYPKSNIVEDALFLIGKSYFYQDEFLKAERKFTELLAKSPNGTLALESQLWLLKTLQRLNRFDDALRVGEDLSSTAADAGRGEIAGEALMILGDIAVSQKNTDGAVEQYAKAVATYDDGAMQAAAQMKIGDLYFSVPDYAKAAPAYFGVQKYSPDDYTLYRTQIQAAIAYRHSKGYDQSLEILRKLESDYRFLDYRGTIRFEIGNTFAQSGKVEEAINMYRLVDSTNSKTEAGARAAFELGMLYQYEIGSYVDARGAYAHATVGGAQELTLDATKKVTALDSYFRLQQQFFKLDSIFYILDIDSMWIKKDSSASLVKKDSSFLLAKKEYPALPMKKDSLAPLVKMDSSASLVIKDSILAVKDTTLLRTRLDTPKSLRDTVQISKVRDTTLTRTSASSLMIQKPKKDTLVATLGRLAYLLGELFYTDLDVPDSTFFWLNRSLKLGLDSVKTPRALYVLSEVARSSSDRRYGEEEDLYWIITEKYPKSLYAEEARIALGYRPTLTKEDPAASVYAVAESLMYAGRYQKALDSLGRIVRDFSDSPLVPKSRYTMGWIYENHLANPDSALSQYKTLAQKYVTTKYGLAAQRRIPPADSLVQSAADSVKKSLLDARKKVLADTTKKAIPDSSLRAGVPQVLKAPVDTTGGRAAIRPPKPDSAKGNLDLDPIERRAAAGIDSLKNRRNKEVEKP